jgi:hypothetical protein
VNSLDPGALVSLFWTTLTVSEIYGVPIRIVAGVLELTNNFIRGVVRTKFGG